MRIPTLALIAYVVFLGVYAYIKYTAAAPPIYVPAYAANVAILVAMTGVAPFALCLLVARAAPLGLPARVVITAAAGVAFCVAAYALFFKLFIEGAAPGADIVDVARRGIGWGALQGALAALAIGGARAPA
jgi:hypothetical protein